jgi:uncharacterized protein
MKMLRASSLQSSGILTALDDRVLQLIIMPTEACNFRCSYCYEDFALGRMKPTLVAAIKALISKRSNELDCLKISWFGGEPLLARSIVLEISQHANALGAAQDFLFQSDMTTNAFLLTDRVVSDLVSVGVNEFQVSLDGPKQNHDNTRVQANKQGSFDRIYENLTTIKRSDRDVRVLLRLHVHQGNAATIPEFVSELERVFLSGDERFALVLKPIEKLGGQNDDLVEVISASEREKLVALFGSLVQSGKSSRVRRSATDSQICYAARPNSFVIRSDGRIGKCTVALQDGRNAIGYLGEDGSVHVDNAKLAPWVRGLATLNPTELACPLANFPLSN